MSSMVSSRGAFIAIALLVSLSFALGYMWGRNGFVVPIVIEKCSDA